MDSGGDSGRKLYYFTLNGKPLYSNNMKAIEVLKKMGKEIDNLSVIDMNNLTFKGTDKDCLIWVNESIMATYNTKTKQIRCNCPIFKDRGSCWHTDFVKNEMDFKIPKRDSPCLVLNKDGLKHLLKKLVEDKIIGYKDLKLCFSNVMLGREIKDEDVQGWLDGKV